MSKRPCALHYPHRACPVCGRHDRKLLFEQRFEMRSEGALLPGYAVVTCGDCGCGYADRIPQQDVFDAYYGNMSKYEYVDTGGRESKYIFDRYRLSAALIQEVGLPAETRILDIGCSTGGLLAVLKESGYSRVTGLDPSPTCAEAAKRLYDIPVLTKTIWNLDPATEQFDLIILSNVLEHIRDAASALATVRSVLSEKGHIFIEVPDTLRFADCEEAPFQQFSTEHINFFSSISLTNIMRLAGFEPVAFRQFMIETEDGQLGVALDGVFRRSPTAAAVGIEPDTQTHDALARYIADSQRVDDRIRGILDGVVASQQPILVWGVGTHTQRLLATSRLAEANIVAYIDSNPRYQGQSLHGAPIITAASLDGCTEPILISSRLYQRNIHRQIRESLHLPNEVLLLYDI